MLKSSLVRPFSGKVFVGPPAGSQTLSEGILSVFCCNFFPHQAPPIMIVSFPCGRCFNFLGFYGGEIINWTGVSICPHIMFRQGINANYIIKDVTEFERDNKGHYGIMGLHNGIVLIM